MHICIDSLLNRFFYIERENHDAKKFKFILKGNGLSTQTTHFLMNENLTRPDYDMHSCSNHGFSVLDCQGQNVIV